MAEAVTVVFGANQLGDQIVGQRVTALGHHAVHVGVELPTGSQDHRLVLGDVPGEQFEDVVGPVGEQLPVLAGSAQQRADDRDRVGPGDVGDHVAAARAGVGSINSVMTSVIVVAQPGGGTGREGFGHQSAKPGVLGAVAAEQALDGPVPKWAGGDALGPQAQPAGHREPRIAQHSPHQLVAHDFDTARVQRDRRLLPYLPHHSVCVIGFSAW